MARFFIDRPVFAWVISLLIILLGSLALTSLPVSQYPTIIVTLSTRDGSMDVIALGNYIATSVLDPVCRVSGVGEANTFGTEYAMRVWLNPDKLQSFSLTPADVTDALRSQNAQVPVGQLGARPAATGQQLNVIVQGRSTLRMADQFGEILLRVNPEGSQVRLKDVARVELGGQDYSKARVNGRPSSAIAVKLAPSANALATAENVRKK